MVRSLILKTAIRYLLPLLLLFSLFILFRGHNDPGGGFVAGLLASSAFALYAIGFGVARARLLLRVEPLALIRSGLAVAVLSAFLSVLTGQTFMTTLWSPIELPGIGKLSTVLLFDVGVSLVVVGVVCLIVFNLAILAEEHMTTQRSAREKLQGHRD